MGKKVIEQIAYMDIINRRMLVRCPRCKEYYDFYDRYFEQKQKPPFFTSCQDCKLVFKVNKVHFKRDIDIKKIKERWSTKEHQEKMKAALNLKPNKLELDFFQTMIDQIPNLKYTGDFSSFVGGKNPDFIVEGTNKCIDLFGEYWHKKPNEEEDRKEYFKEEGFELLVIWEFEWKSDKQKCIDDIIHFVS